MMQVDVAHQVEPTDCFVSYSRVNSADVEGCVAEIQATGASAWVDVSQLRPAGEWLDEIHSAIDRARAFVAFLSNAYLDSEICRAELERARSAGKVVIPVVLADLHHERVPDWLRALNWIHLENPEQRPRAVARILEAAHADREWADYHSGLLVRAQEWENAGHPPRLLLRGEDIDFAERQIDVIRSAVDAQVNSVQREFVRSSRRHRRRWIRRGFTLAAVITAASLALTLVALRQRAVANEQRAEAIEQQQLAEAAEQRAQLALSRSEYQRFATLSENASDGRTAATAAIASSQAALEGALSEPEAATPMMRVIANGGRPLTTYLGRGDNQQYTGDHQGVAVSGDGSTMAYLALSGELRVIDLWDNSVRLEFDGGGAGSYMPQVALDFSGDQLLLAADGEFSTSRDETTYNATFTLYDISGDVATQTKSGTVELGGLSFAVGLAPDDSIAVVTTDGLVNVVDTHESPWIVESLGEEVVFTAAGGAQAWFSADGNRVCVYGEFNAFYQLRPLRQIAVPSGPCIPEPCAGSASNRLELGDGFSVRCVDPQNATVFDESWCEICVIPRGLDTEHQLVQVPPGLAAANGVNALYRHAVPGPSGVQVVTTGTDGVTSVWSEVLAPTLRPESVDELLNSYQDVLPSGQPDNGRMVAADGTLVEVSGDGTREVVGRFADDLPLEGLAQAHLVGNKLVAVNAVQGNETLVIDHYEASMWELGDAVPSSFSPGDIEGAAFVGDTAAFIVDGSIELWNLTSEERIVDIPQGGWPVCQIGLSQSMTSLAAVSCPQVGSDRSELRVWHLRDGAWQLIDRDSLLFADPAAVAISDEAETVAIAHAAGQIEIRSDRGWVNAPQLLTEANPTNDYHSGWTAVDRTGKWVLSRRNGEGLDLWLVAAGSATPAAGLLTEDPINAPVDVHFDAASLRLAWGASPVGEPSGSIARWDLRVESLREELCNLFAVDAAPSECDERIDAAPAPPEIRPPTVATIPKRQRRAPLTVIDSYTVTGLRPASIGVAGDGAVWVSGDGITRIDTGGVLNRLISSGGPFENLMPYGDAGMAFTYFTGLNALATIAPNGATTVHLPNSNDAATAWGADGPVLTVDRVLWAFSSKANAILEITDGGIIEHDLPSDFSADRALGASVGDHGITFIFNDSAASDSGSTIVTVDPGGQIETFSTASAATIGVPAGGGALWLHDPLNNSLTWEGADGDRVALDFGQYGSQIAVFPGTDGELWFTTGLGIGVVDTYYGLGQLDTRFWPVDGASAITDLVAVAPDELWIVDSDTEEVTHLRTA